MTQLESLITIVGGIGVFLLGMMIMTDGLKVLAGARISQWLADRTTSPWSGAMTGAIGTAILQSSSATTVAAVGFVGAGLLTFSQSLGIIFGANIGTTITGWMVALLGFKLSLGSLLLPLVFIGVMMRLFAGPRSAQVGFAMAGFGLVFLGIDLLQQSAGSYSEAINLQAFAADSWLGRIKLVLIGVLITVLTQSSSAGVATTLVAIHAGVITFEQGAALVIGMDVGTTFTAAIATIGASSSARRTGFSHVIYNCFTAAGALILITPFIQLWPLITQAPILANPEIGLVAFHSTFNLLGALLVLPFAARFASLMEWLVPETGSTADRYLDWTLLKEPAVALLSAREIIVAEYLRLIRGINAILARQSEEIVADMSRQQSILDDTHVFLDQLVISNPESVESRQLVSLIHTVDHMQRLLERCNEEERAFIASHREQLENARFILDSEIDDMIAAVEESRFKTAHEIAEHSWQRLQQLETTGRDSIYSEVALGRVDVNYATECAEALRWLTRVSRHLSRICYYLDQAGGDKKPDSKPTEARRGR